MSMNKLKEKTSGKLIYLACPYTHPDPAVRKKRALLATQVSAVLLKSELINFSPLTLQIPLEEATDFPHTWAYWKDIDLLFVDKCDEVWIVHIEGWDISTGVLAEKKYAESQGKPIRFVHILKSSFICEDLARLHLQIITDNQKDEEPWIIEITL